LNLHAGIHDAILGHHVEGNQICNRPTQRCRNLADVVVVHDDASGQVSRSLNDLLEPIGIDVDREFRTDAGWNDRGIELHDDSTTPQAFRSSEVQGPHEGQPGDFLVIVVGLHDADVAKSIVDARHIFNEDLGAGAQGQTETDGTSADGHVPNDVDVWPRQSIQVDAGSIGVIDRHILNREPRDPGLAVHGVFRIDAAGENGDILEGDVVRTECNSPANLGADVNERPSPLCTRQGQRNGNGHVFDKGVGRQLDVVAWRGVADRIRDGLMPRSSGQVLHENELALNQGQWRHKASQNCKLTEHNT